MFGQSSFGAAAGNRGGSATGLSPGMSMLNGQSILGNTNSLVGNGFVGRADKLDTFIGRQMANGAGTSSLGRNMSANPRNARTRQRGNDPNSTNGTAGSVQPQQTIRMMTRQRIAFSHPSVPASSVETRLNGRFGESLQKRLDATNLSFNLDSDGLLTMTGDVKSTDAKDLAEMIARMEPGVRDVRNDLTVTANDSRQ